MPKLAWSKHWYEQGNYITEKADRQCTTVAKRLYVNLMAAYTQTKTLPSLIAQRK